MNLDEMLKEAIKQGVYIPKDLLPEACGNITGDILEKMKRADYLMKPIIMEGAKIIIFGATGVAKTWLAMTIVLGLVNGKSVFPDRWVAVNKDGIKCVIIAGEMDEGEYGERLKRLNQHYAVDDAHKGNFILHRADQLDIASPEGVKRLNEIINDAEKNCGERGKPVKLVILDNLTTLSVEGENPSNFGRIEYALKSLQSRGISVVLIHHENQKGDIRGARKISDVMDMKLHLYKANDGDKIGIIVKNEKIRSGKQSEFATFKAVLDVDAPGTGWVVSDPTPEELARIDALDEIQEESPAKPVVKVSKTKYNQTAWEWLNDEERIKSVLEHRRSGYNNAQIAVNHATSETTICDFRKANNIRDCDLKKTGLDFIDND